MSNPTTPPSNEFTSITELGTPRNGLNPENQTSATLLRLRITNGEKIPLEELRAFLISANKDLGVEKKKRNVDKPTDVDFF